MNTTRLRGFRLSVGSAKVEAELLLSHPKGPLNWGPHTSGRLAPTAMRMARGAGLTTPSSWVATISGASSRSGWAAVGALIPASDRDFGLYIFRYTGE